MCTLPKSKLIAAYLYYIDSTIRNDLFSGRIRHEDDYTSNLASGITHFPHSPINHPPLAIGYSRKLGGAEERRFGADGIIIFQTDAWIKVCLFEAKYPRLNQAAYAWDRDKRNLSRFHSQLQRQKKWSKNAAIWEMFYDENQVGVGKSPRDRYGSACVWHEIAHKFDASRKTKKSWKNTELLQMLNARPTSSKTHGYGSNLYDMILQVLTCKRGARIKNDRADSFTLYGDDDEVNIPLPRAETQYRGILKFLEETGLSVYMFIYVGENVGREFE